MAFRKKANEILKYKPDILIIQESENLAKLNTSNFSIQPKQSFWFGDNPSKGISIFSFGSATLEILNQPLENDKWIIPFSVNGQYNFILFPVWAMNHRANKVINGTGPSYATFERYSDYLKNDVIIAGDFNDNKIWDKDYFEYGTFSDLAKLFENHNIKSCYHTYFNESYGEEKLKTLYWRKNLKTAYHIDYCFAKDKFISNIENINVGEPNIWLNLSDHVPVIMDLNHL